MLICPLEQRSGITAYTKVTARDLVKCMAQWGRILEVFDHLLPWLSKPTIINTLWCGQKIVRKTKI